MFVGASMFLRTLVGIRVVWFAGRFGGGKTLLSFASALWLYDHGYVEQVVSNIPSSITVPVSAPLLNTAIVFDEAWIELDAREWQRNVGRTVGAYLRKYNLFLLLPSVFAVDKRFRALFVQRVFNAYAFGLPFYVYRWGIELGVVKESGFFMLWKPSQYFGTYDHLATPSGDGGIVAAMAATTPEIVGGADGAGQWTGDVSEYEGIRQSFRGQETKGKRRRKG